MKTLLINLAALLILLLSLNGCSKNKIIKPLVYKAQPDENSAVTDSAFDGKIINDIAFAKERDWNGNSVTLAMDIYIPSSVKDTGKLPLVVSIHGGAFEFGDKSEIAAACQLLASKGYIVAAINYRLGWNWIDKNDPNHCLADTATLDEAWYRAQQDTRAAFRFLAANASKYSIATKWMFVEGSSAGAEAALGVAYFTQDTADIYLHGISDTLGLLDNSGNKLKNTYKIKGVASMWGAMRNPDFITAENAVPTIFFHGMLGKGVPYNVGHYWDCDNFAIAYGSKRSEERV